MSIEKRESPRGLARQDRKAHRRAVRAELKARVAEDRSNARDYYTAEKAGRWGSVGVTFMPAVLVLFLDPLGHALLLPVVMTPPLIMAAHTAIYFDKSTYLYRLRRGRVQSPPLGRNALEEGEHS